MVLIDKHEFLTEEEKRLKEDRDRTRYWKRWGPYVAERQWATGAYGLNFNCRGQNALIIGFNGYSARRLLVS